MPRRDPGQPGALTYSLDLTVNVDVRPPDLRGALRQGMVESVRTLETEIRRSMALFFHGHFSGRADGFRRRGGPAEAALVSTIQEAPSGFRSATGWGSDHFYLRILEAGARPHTIRSREFLGTGRRRRRIRNPKELAIPAPGGTIYRRQVRHPGLRRRPFMEYAAQRAEPRIIDIMNRRIAEAIDHA